MRSSACWTGRRESGSVSAVPRPSRARGRGLSFPAGPAVRLEAVRSTGRDYRYPHFKRHHLVDGLAFDGPPPGRPMPDFDLPTTDGARIRTGDFVGRRPLLLTFGSITCPMTASADSDLKRLHAAFGERVAFATLYVREAHPGDRYPQPETMAHKLAHARAYRERHRIPWAVAVDGIDGDLHRALGARTPNAAYLMGSDGIIAFRSLHSNDERALRVGLRAIVSQHPGPIGERRSLVVPLLKGVGLMAEVLSLAGPRAARDLRREVPAVYALARLAALFHPLPPLGRGIAATATSLLGPPAATAGMCALLARRSEGPHQTSPGSGTTYRRLPENESRRTAAPEATIG